MPLNMTDPTPSLTVMPEIFSQVTATVETEREIEKACELIRNDPSVDVTLRDHIIRVILNMRGLPNALHLARSIIGIQKASDTGSVQAFIEMFIAGIRFLRVADEDSPIYEDDESDEDSLAGPDPESYPRLDRRNHSPTDEGPVCEVSGHHGPGSYLVDATIFPCTLSDTGCCQIRQQHLWDLLCCFWKAPVVNKIIDQCGTKDASDGIKHFTNGILMSSACRQAFKRLKFYLLPIPETFSATQYEVEFHWIDRPIMSAQPNYRLSPKLTDDFYLRYQPFRSGDRITFTTVDPIKYPLPDPGLLFARSLIARISLPMELTTIRNHIIRGHEYLDYAESDTDSDNDSAPDIFDTATDIETWIDNVPVWDGRDLPIDGGGGVVTE